MNHFESVLRVGVGRDRDQMFPAWQEAMPEVECGSPAAHGKATAGGTSGLHQRAATAVAFHSACVMAIILCFKQVEEHWFRTRP